ncbi:MAG TPA: hypothetical protein VN982_09680 [Candidatus Dormibacteraeota bacterium]|nr:hypothetical protein [Candidatus Dormibacteraeota bacterium]
MSLDQKNPQTPPSPEVRRRSGRFPVLVPVEVSWEDPQRKIVTVEAQAKEVNSHGGLLQFLDTDLYPAIGTEMKLTNLFSREEAHARAAAVRRAKDGTIAGVAIELLFPSEVFWGLTFQLRKATAELNRLDQAIRSGDIDSRVLREFRDSVDYVRKTAWAVQEWQERQIAHRDTATVLPLLYRERVRRATQLCGDLTDDLKHGKIGVDTPGIEDFHAVIYQLAQELAARLTVPQSK